MRLFLGVVRKQFFRHEGSSFGNGKRLEIYTEIEADMKTPEEINKEGYPYTYIQMDERGVAQYSVNPVIMHGQKLFSASLSKGSMKSRRERAIRSWHTGVRWDTLMQWHCRTIYIRRRLTSGE